MSRKYDVIEDTVIVKSLRTKLVLLQVAAKPFRDDGPIDIQPKFLLMSAQAF